MWWNVKRSASNKQGRRWQLSWKRKLLGATKKAVPFPFLYSMLLSFPESLPLPFPMSSLPFVKRVTGRSAQDLEQNRRLEKSLDAVILDSFGRFHFGRLYLNWIALLELFYGSSSLWHVLAMGWWKIVCLPFTGAAEQKHGSKKKPLMRDLRQWLDLSVGLIPCSFGFLLHGCL